MPSFEDKIKYGKEFAGHVVSKYCIEQGCRFDLSGISGGQGVVLQFQAENRS